MKTHEISYIIHLTFLHEIWEICISDFYALKSARCSELTHMYLTSLHEMWDIHISQMSMRRAKVSALLEADTYVKCEKFVSHNSSWNVRYMYLKYPCGALKSARCSELPLHVGCQMNLQDVTRRLPCTGYQTCRNVQRNRYAFTMSLSYM